MPSDTTTLTIPTALVEAVREASRDRVPPWPEHRRYGMCAAQTEALAGMLDAIIAASPAPAAEPDPADLREVRALDAVAHEADAVVEMLFADDIVRGFSEEQREVVDDLATAIKAWWELHACKRCKGSGLVAPGDPCGECGGDGRREREGGFDLARALRPALRPAPAQPDLDALEAAMRDATPALDTMREMAESVGYGYWHPDNPHDFSPDEQSCTAEEIAAHKAACEAYDQGARVAPPPVHDIGRDDAGRVVVSLLTPAWGIGSYVMRDDAMGAARSVVLAVGPLVAELRRLRALVAQGVPRG